MNEKEKGKLVDKYVSRLIDDMDIDTLAQLVYEILYDQKIEYTDEELKEEIKEFCEELLD